MSPSDAERELLARCLRGDAAGWNSLFDLHFGPTTRFVFQLGPDLTTEDVEEICQETFVTVVRSLHTFQGQSQFQTWLFRIAGNKARDYRQRLRAAKRGGGRVPLSLNAEDPETGLKLDPAGSALSPDLHLIRLENIALVGHALDRLGGACEEILQLRYFADLSYEEIAVTLSLNPKTVSSRLSKCLDKLELVIKELLVEESKNSASV